MSWSLTKPEVFVWFGNVTNQAGSPVLSTAENEPLPPGCSQAVAMATSLAVGQG
jgi:hypothetical protein